MKLNVVCQIYLFLPPHFPEPRSSSKNLWCYQIPLSKCKSHSIFLWSSTPLLISKKLFLRKPTGAHYVLLTAIRGNRKKVWVSLPPLHCVGLIAFQSVLCLRLEIVGMWDALLCNAILKEILHNSSFFLPVFFYFFGEPSSKCHWQTLLILTSLWSWSAKSCLLGFSASHGTGWYWDDNEALFSKEWMN